VVAASIVLSVAVSREKIAQQSFKNRLNRLLTFHAIAGKGIVRCGIHFRGKSCGAQIWRRRRIGRGAICVAICNEICLRQR
jgi:hypothetical protein